MEEKNFKENLNLLKKELLIQIDYYNEKNNKNLSLSKLSTLLYNFDSISEEKCKKILKTKRIEVILEKDDKLDSELIYYIGSLSSVVRNKLIPNKKNKQNKKNKKKPKEVDLQNYLTVQFTRKPQYRILLNAFILLNILNTQEIYMMFEKFNILPTSQEKNMYSEDFEKIHTLKDNYKYTTYTDSENKFQKYVIKYIKNKNINLTTCSLNLNLPSYFIKDLKNNYDRKININVALSILNSDDFKIPLIPYNGKNLSMDQANYFFFDELKDYRAIVYWEQNKDLEITEKILENKYALSTRIINDNFIKPLNDSLYKYINFNLEENNKENIIRIIKTLKNITEIINMTDDHLLDVLSYPLNKLDEQFKIDLLNKIETNTKVKYGASSCAYNYSLKQHNSRHYTTYKTAVIKGITIHKIYRASTNSKIKNMKDLFLFKGIIDEKIKSEYDIRD